MSQRLYHEYERPLCEKDSNSKRDKASKMNQIETYVNVLIENNKVYADQINCLKRDNSDLRGQVEVLMGDVLRQREKYQHTLADNKSEYSRQVGRLIDELKDILSKKQQMQGSYRSLLQQMTYQSEFDKKSRGCQLQQIQRNYQNKMKILNDRLNEQSRQIQKNFYMSSDNKLRMVKEIDGLNYEVCELRKENADLRQAHLFDQAEMNRLSGVLKGLSKEKEEMGVNLLKMQQDKNNQIIQLKQAMGQLREQLNDQIDHVKKYEIALSTKEKELQSLMDRHDLQVRSKGECEEQKIKVSSDLNGKMHQLAQLKNQYNRLSDFSNKELKRMSELIRMLQTENKKMMMDKQEAEDNSRVKQEEVYTLLDQVQCFQNQNETLNAKSLKIEELNYELDREVNVLRDEVESLLLELKNQQQKCQLQMNHMTTLEQMVDKEKRRNGYLEGSCIDREIVAKQVPGEISKKYESQIQDILRRGDLDKSELTQKFQQQKQRLIRMYEKALRQKEIIFKQKIMILEREVREMNQ